MLEYFPMENSSRKSAMLAISLFKLAVFIAISLSKCYCQEDLSLSTVLEKFVENIKNPFSSPKERCVEYLNSNLNEFLQKLERQTLNKVRIKMTMAYFNKIIMSFHYIIEINHDNITVYKYRLPKVLANL